MLDGAMCFSAACLQSSLMQRLFSSPTACNRATFAFSEFELQSHGRYNPLLDQANPLNSLQYPHLLLP